MWRILLSVFLTLVAVSFSVEKTFAAPSVQKTQMNDIEKKDDTPEQKNVIEGLDISTPPPEKKASDETSIYFPYESSISPRLGMGTDSTLLAQNTYYYLFGFNYLFQSTSSSHLEVGFDLINDGSGVITVGQRTIYDQSTYLRPYFKIAVGLKTNASDQLNTFLKKDNYRLIPSMGLERILFKNSSARIDLEPYLTLTTVGLILVMGYSYAF